MYLQDPHSQRRVSQHLNGLPTRPPRDPFPQLLPEGFTNTSLTLPTLRRESPAAPHPEQPQAFSRKDGVAFEASPPLSAPNPFTSRTHSGAGPGRGSLTASAARKNLSLGN